MYNCFVNVQCGEKANNKPTVGIYREKESKIILTITFVIFFSSGVSLIYLQIDANKSEAN